MTTVVLEFTLGEEDDECISYSAKLPDGSSVDGIVCDHDAVDDVLQNVYHSLGATDWSQSNVQNPWLKHD